MLPAFATGLPLVLLASLRHPRQLDFYVVPPTARAVVAYWVQFLSLAQRTTDLPLGTPLPETLGVVEVFAGCHESHPIVQTNGASLSGTDSVLAALPDSIDPNHSRSETVCGLGLARVTKYLSLSVAVAAAAADHNDEAHQKHPANRPEDDAVGCPHAPTTTAILLIIIVITLITLPVDAAEGTSDAVAVVKEISIIATGAPVASVALASQTA